MVQALIGVAILGMIVAVMYLLSDKPEQVARKHLWPMLKIIAAYAIVLIVSMIWLARGRPPHPWNYLAAVLPVFPALLTPVLVARRFRQLDELHQKIQLQGLAFGFTGAATLTFTYGFLERAGLPTLSWIWVWPVMLVCWVIGVVWAHARYR